MCITIPRVCCVHDTVERYDYYYFFPHLLLFVVNIAELYISVWSRGVQSLFLTTTIKNWRTAHNCAAAAKRMLYIYIILLYFFLSPEKGNNILLLLRETSTTYIIWSCAMYMFVCVCTKTWRYCTPYMYRFTV